MLNGSAMLSPILPDSPAGIMHEGRRSFKVTAAAAMVRDLLIIRASENECSDIRPHNHSTTKAQRSELNDDIHFNISTPLCAYTGALF